MFKPSARKEIFGVVLSESLKNVGITVITSNNDSQLACSACYRKIENLCELVQFIVWRLAQKREENKENSEGARRKLFDDLSPAVRGSPANRTTVRTNSPETESNEKGMTTSNARIWYHFFYKDHSASSRNSSKRSLDLPTMLNEWEDPNALEWQVADQSEQRTKWFIKSDQSGSRFSKVLKSFRALKVRTLWLQSCFILIFLTWTEVSFIQEVSGVYTSSFLDTDELKMALRARKVSEVFEKRAQDFYGRLVDGRNEENNKVLTGRPSSKLARSTRVHFDPFPPVLWPAAQATQWFNLCHSILKGEFEDIFVTVDVDTKRGALFHSCLESLVYVDRSY